jgi:hypothetical protein
MKRIPSGVNDIISEYYGYGYATYVPCECDIYDLSQDRDGNLYCWTYNDEILIWKADGTSKVLWECKSDIWALACDMDGNLYFPHNNREILIWREGGKSKVFGEYENGISRL